MSKRPNVVLILCDDMGYSDIGCYGGEVLTPNLDRLATNGLRFSQFYSTPRCSPSRASLLTGLHPHQTGIGVLTWRPDPAAHAKLAPGLRYGLATGALIAVYTLWDGWAVKKAGIPPLVFYWAGEVARVRVAP